MQFGVLVCITYFITLAWSANISQIVTSDVCMHPSQTILSHLNGDAYNFASYYFDCMGTNPVTNYLNTAFDILNNYPANLTQQVYAKLQKFNSSPSYQQCVNGNYHAGYLFIVTNLLTDVYPLNYLNTSVFNAAHQLNVIAANLDCSEISSNWHELTDTSICTYSFDGVLTFCLTMYIAAGFLFATICVTSVLYQYFHLESLSTVNLMSQEEDYDEVNVSAVPAKPYHEVTNDEHKAWYEV